MNAQLSLPRPGLPSLDYGVGAGFVLLLTGLIGFGLAQAGTAPLRLELYGEAGLIDPAELQAAAAPVLAGGFFAVDSRALEERLARHPWVHSVQVQRLWPDRLAVELRSHEPVARWGEDQILTASGALIRPAQRPSLALQVMAPEAELAAVREDLAALQEQLPERWSLREWRVSRTGDRQALLEIRGQTLRLEFGRDPVAEKVALFAQAALPVLLPQLEQVAVVDLRYRNGFAVRWAQGEASE